MVPKRPPEGPTKLSFASPSKRNTFPREVHMDLRRTQMNDGETRRAPWMGMTNRRSTPSGIICSKY